LIDAKLKIIHERLFFSKLGFHLISILFVISFIN
jgi:hypothetical protein